MPPKRPTSRRRPMVSVEPPEAAGGGEGRGVGGTCHDFFVVTDCWGGSKLKKVAPQSCGSSLQICNPFVAAPLFDKRRTLRGVRERSGARRRKPFMKKLRRR